MSSLPTHCRHCNKPVPGPGWITCGASKCQETEYYANRERNFAKRSRR